MVGVGWVAVILLWLIGLAALFGIIYAAVRLAALHALKAHTRWLDAGRLGGASPAYPAAQQPYPGYPNAQPRQPGQPAYPGAQPGYPAPQSAPGQPYPGYPGGQQGYGGAQPTQPTTPLPQPGTEEPPARPQV
jgi:hypothetical protein